MAAKKKRVPRGSKARPVSASPVAANLPSPAVALGRVSKGKRPQFHDSEAVDQLFAVVTALTAELSVAFDRIDTVERVLVSNGVIAADCVEAFEPSSAAADVRRAKREALIQRIFSVFEAYGAP